MAGTTASGIPYPEATDTAKIYPALAQNAAEEIEDQLAAKGSLSGSVRAFADSAARATAIPTPTEGMMSSLNDTDAVERYDGATWKPVGGGGLVLIKTQVVGTTVSSVTVTDAFSATYDNYLVTLNGGVASAAVYLTGRLGATSTGYYESRLVVNIPAGSVDGNLTDNGAELRLGAGTTSHVWIKSWFGSPFLSKPTQHEGMSTDITQMAYIKSLLNNSTSYTAFTIYSNSGTITGGTIRVYGYQNS